jgi:hypothetical protein
VVAPLAAGWLITTAGYGPAFGLVAACSLATAWLLVGAEGAHVEQLVAEQVVAGQLGAD